MYLNSKMSLGNTGGLLRAAEVEERYAITWESQKEGIFETPTGGSIWMKKGECILYYAKKEQCLALGSQLQTFFKITNYNIYRIFPGNRIQFLHPKDGEFPEKVNKGRIGVGNVDRSIGQNIDPVFVKFTGKNTFDLPSKVKRGELQTTK